MNPTSNGSEKYGCVPRRAWVISMYPVNDTCWARLVPWPTLIPWEIFLREFFCSTNCANLLQSARPWAYRSVGCGDSEMTLDKDSIKAHPDRRTVNQRTAVQAGEEQKDNGHCPYWGWKCRDAQRDQDQGRQLTTAPFLSHLQVTGPWPRSLSPASSCVAPARSQTNLSSSNKRGDHHVLTHGETLGIVVVYSLSHVWLFCDSMRFSGKNTGMGYHFLLQGIFPTQGSNPSLLHCQ